MGPEEEEEEEKEKEKEVELVLSTAEDLKDLNVNQLLGHLYSTKNKEASNRIQQCILEGMHMSSIYDRVKPDNRLQKNFEEKQNYVCPNTKESTDSLLSIGWEVSSI